MPAGRARELHTREGREERARSGRPAAVGGWPRLAGAFRTGAGDRSVQPGWTQLASGGAAGTSGGRSPSLTSVQEELPRPIQAGRDLHQPRSGVKGPAVAGSWSLLNLCRVPRGGSVPVRIFPLQQQSKVTILTILMSAFYLWIQSLHRDRQPWGPPRTNGLWGCIRK